MQVGFNLKSLNSGSIVPIIAGLLAVAALWMAWNGWQRFSSSRLEAASGQARQQVADALKPMVAELLDRAGTLRGRVALINALRAPDNSAAMAVAKETVPGTEAVEFYSPDFNAGYADRISVDQLIANRVGTKTTFRSLEFGVRVVGGGPLEVISYRDSNQPNQPVDDPWQMYSRIFANGNAGVATVR